MKDYHINVFCSEEDESYVADILGAEASAPTTSGRWPHTGALTGMPQPAFPISTAASQRYGRELTRLRSLMG